MYMLDAMICLGVYTGCPGEDGGAGSALPQTVVDSEGGMIRLEAVVELEFIHSSFSSLSPY